MPRLEERPIHLGPGAAAIPQPPFTGMDWFEAYGARHGKDGAEGRLVSFHRFSQNWDMWEMHPAGDEVVLCLSGTLVLHQEHGDGRCETVAIRPGDYAINPAGCWHTADVAGDIAGDIAGEASALFITSGIGTQHRPR